MRWPVSWREATLVSSACWAACGLAYAASTALNEDAQPSVAFFAGAWLVQ
ncbi:hypothetical protein LUX12_20290 [Streptomyces somaliensis]|nr:hypothetical protein [Streptomyces somaliensis]MCP9946593.1 hypothetical protein [Streptomyces somaliensis]MCP9960272.1 hypothetical protein [Streptomyces somaliensis]MCP9973038.1 hypothetical protein [Streptomyces somaliensis]